MTDRLEELRARPSPSPMERILERLRRPLLDRLRERETYTPPESADGVTYDIALIDHDIQEAIAQIESLRAEVARLKAVHQWQPIETAPFESGKTIELWFLRPIRDGVLPDPYPGGGFSRVIECNPKYYTLETARFAGWTHWRYPAPPPVAP